MQLILIIATIALIGLLVRSYVRHTKKQGKHLHSIYVRPDGELNILRDNGKWTFHDLSWEATSKLKNSPLVGKIFQIRSKHERYDVVITFRKNGWHGRHYETTITDPEGKEFCIDLCETDIESYHIKDGDVLYLTHVGW